MGDTNKIDLGEGASAKQVAAGQNITQTIIEQQINNYGARPGVDVRFSLPTPPRDFMGRASEIETLVGQLTRGERAAITGVAGMGGVGKSALAQVVAQRVAAHFPDGRLWIDVRGTDTQPTAAADAMRQVIQAIEPTADVSKADDAMLAQFYRGVLQGKRVLLVLDNAQDNVQIRPLLQADAAFLITARATLTEGGLKPLRLDVMNKEDAEKFLGELCARLRPSSPAGTPSSPALLPKGEGSEVEELANMCGYLPLALKIAGSYLAARPNVKPALYLAQLRERRLELLRERNDPALNVEAGFSVTYNQLPPDLQTLWRLLGVFPAPFWGRAAQYIWGIEDEAEADAALGELHRESLIEYDETEDKYRLHDLLREFAWRRRTDDERRMTEKRHAELYKDVARLADDLYLKCGENVVAGLKLFDGELIHIRAGQKWAAEHWEVDEDVARLCIQYPNVAAFVMDLRLSPREQILWLYVAVESARWLGERKAEGIALGNLGIAYKNLGELRMAIECYEQRLMIAQETGDRQGEGTVLGNLGNAYVELDEVQRAIEYYEQRFVIARELGDRRGEEAVLGNLGNAYQMLNDNLRAIEYHERALAIAHEIGDRRGEGRHFGNLGVAFENLGEKRKAIEYHERALEIAREIGDQRQEALSLGNLGNRYVEADQIRKALEYHGKQLTIAREMGERPKEGIALCNIGNAYFNLGEVRHAIEYYEQALAVMQVTNSRRTKLSIFHNLGIAYADLGDVQMATEYHDEALVIAREIGDKSGEGDALANIGLAYRRLGDAKRAKELWEEALDIYVAIESPKAEWVKRQLKEADGE